MKPPPIRFVQAQEIEEAFSFENLDLDLDRNLAVYIRQSKKGAHTEHGESREAQLALVKVAKKLIEKQKRCALVEVFDEKDGMSGQKGAHERPELFGLLTRCKAGFIGTIFVIREDRLYRDEYGDESGSFLRIANEQHTTVVVPMPGSTKKFKVYRLWRYEDRERFKEAMKTSAAYLNQIRDMNSKGRQKAARGCYDGRPLPPGLAILNPPKGLSKEEKKEWKRNQKPVLYEPWAHVMREVFQELQNCNWDIARVFRAIHARETPLFPEISAEDERKYFIKHFLTPITKGGQKGFTVGYLESMKRWIPNFHLLGWWLTWPERNEDTSEEIPGGWIPNNHPAVIDRAVLEEGHMKLTGYTIEGEPVPHVKIKQYRRHTKSLGNPLLPGLLRYPDERVTITKSSAKDTREGNRAQEYVNYVVHAKYEDDVFNHTLFIIPAFALDVIIVRRIEEFCTVDQTHDMAQRVKNRLEQIRKRQTHDYAYIETELQRLDREIAAFRRRLVTVVNVFGISEEQAIGIGKVQKNEKEEDDEVKLVKDLKDKIEKRKAAQQNLLSKKQQLALIDEQQIDRYYEVLNHFSEKFSLIPYEEQHQLISSLIKQITIKDLSPHWLQVTVEWSETVSLLDRPDVCLIWRNLPIRAGKFTEEETQIIQEMYPRGDDRLEIMQRLPNRSWVNIRKLAKALNVRRKPTNDPIGFPSNLCWSDITAWGYPEQAIALANELATPQKKQEAVSFLAEQWLFPAALVQSGNELHYQEGDQGREVFAVPAGIFSPGAAGVNKLIQDGAHPVTSVNDILGSLNLYMIPQHAEAQSVLPDNDEERALLALLTHEPRHVDEIIRASNLPAHLVSSTLTMMELKGMIRQVGSMQYVVAR